MEITQLARSIVPPMKGRPLLRILVRAFVMISFIFMLGSPFDKERYG